MHGSLRSALLRIDGVFLAMDDVIVDAVLDIGAAVRHAEDSLRVGLVFREEERRRPYRSKGSVRSISDGPPSDDRRFARSGRLALPIEQRRRKRKAFGLSVLPAQDH